MIDNMDSLLYIGLLSILVVCFFIYENAKILKKKTFIDEYVFPEKLTKSLLDIYPHLTNENISSVYKGLKDFFKLYIDSNRRIIVMPSKILHRTLYEFTMNPIEYRNFCNIAFEFTLEHPSLIKVENNIVSSDLKIVWTLACDAEGINPDEPNKIPLIFILDTLLNIEDGFKYSLNNLNDSSYFNVNRIGSLRINKGRA